MTKLMIPRTTPLFTTAFRDVDEMQNRLRRFFDEGFGTAWPATERMGWVPAVEMTEQDDAFVLHAELPGLTKENVEVSFEDDLLTIRGEKMEEKREEKNDKRFHLYERTYGTFTRSFTMPRTIDAAKIVAEFKNGVLTVRMPKAPQALTKGRKIEVAEIK